MPTIRLPQHAYELRVRVLHTACELAEDLHREPTLEEISAKCGDPVELVDRALNQLNLPVMSLGELVDSEGNHDTPRTIQDTIADDQFLDPVASMETGEELERASDEIRVLLATLQALSVSDRNKDVFKKYYGLGGYQEDATLESVSEDYDVTRERIRQLNNQTWARLREAGLSMDDAKLMAAIANVRRLENLAYRETTYDILPRNLKTVEENAINVKDNPLPVVEYVCRMRASGFSAKPQRRVTVHDLLEEICGAYGTTMRPLLSRNQEARAAFLRHIAMYVLHTGLGLPVDEIESYFSGYDASMIQNVCERIETLVSNNEGVREDVEKIQSWCNPSSN
ncbi:MAG: helix-turn-helix domain-containing protein [bacterium]|nr:helix-turn-helix domain-containing protein [bacterium]